jgi:hypothetical protein
VVPVADSDPDQRPTAEHGQPQRLTGADAFRLHATLTLGLAVCVGAFIFELLRALGGHTFSWMYVFEWPLFAGFALYMWWHLYNGTDRHRPSPPAPVSTLPSTDDRAQAPDRDLEAWNRYLLMMELEEIEADRPGPDR